MLLKKADSWDVKDLHTIVLLDFEANHTYKHIRREATITDIEHGKILQNNTVDHRVAPWYTESTNDWSFIIKNFSYNPSPECVVT